MCVCVTFPYILSICYFPELIDKNQCAGGEDAVNERITKLAEEWEYLTTKSSEKSEKLQEANRQRMYTAAVKDLEFWLGEVEHMLDTDDYGKDLATVQNLSKKHQLLEADIKAHEVKSSVDENCFVCM